MSINTELMKALCSPQQEIRKQGEAYLQSLTVDERCNSLLQFVGTTQSNAGGSKSGSSYDDHHYLLLAAVLLRRDILRLTNACMLQEMVTPLLNHFVTFYDSNIPYVSQLRRHIGHCLAAICQTLTLLNHTSECDAVMNAMFHQILPLCTTALDIPSIHLAASLAEWAPQSFQRIGAVQMIPPLMQTALVVLSSNRRPSGDPSLEAIVEMLVFGAIATNPNNADGSTTSSLLSNDSASELGKSGLVPLLPYLSTCCANDGSAIIPILQNLAHAATVCPSFLAGAPGTTTNDSQLMVVTKTFLEIAASNEVETDVRLACLQILSNLYATPWDQQHSSQESIRLLLSGVTSENVFSICAKLMVVGIDDDVQAWANEPLSATDKESALQWDQDRLADDAEFVFESFFQSLGATRCLSRILHIAEQLFADASQWKHQVTALSILQCCLVTAPKSFTPYLVMTVEKALELAHPEHNNNNLRVQYRALWLLGVVCELQPQQHEPHTSRILQTVLQTITTSRNAKVVCMALEVLASFCQGIEKEDVASYLPHVLPTLLAAPWQIPCSSSFDSQQLVSVQIRALRALACWAAAGGEAMVPYYQQVMPSLLHCVQTHQYACANTNHSAASFEMMQMFAAAVETASLVGHAVGQENFELFRPDAQFLLQQVLLPMLVAHQPNRTEGGATAIAMNDDEDLEFVWTACVRIASVMGKEFLPFVPILLPHLLQRATAPPDLEIEEADDAALQTSRRGEVMLDQDEGTESMTVTLPGRGLTKVTVNVSTMQAKALAARAVYELATTLEDDFVPFSTACLEAFLSLVDFPYSSEVRSTAAQTLAAVFQATTCANNDEMVVTDVPIRFLPLLVTAIAKQVEVETSPDPEVLFNLADALSDILYATYRSVKSCQGAAVVKAFNMNHVNAAVQSIMNAMTACLHRRAQLRNPNLDSSTGMQLGDDEAADRSEDELRQEEKLLTALVDSVGCMIKLFRDQFTPLFSTLVSPVLDTYLVNQHLDSRGRHAAVCLWDDCIEHCGPVAVSKHASRLAAGVVLGLNDATNAFDEDLKLAALYGLCQLARYAPAAILEPRTLLSQLVSLCQSNMGGSNSSGNFLVTNQHILENSVSAIASMALIGKAPFASMAVELLPREDLIEIFLNNLPLREDEDEAKICHSGLCDMVQNGQISLANQFRHVFRIIGETLECVANGDEVATQVTCAKMVQILRQLQYNWPVEQMEQAYDSLSAEAQAAIQEAMQQYAPPYSTVVTP